ncbi:MAG: multidrug efflux MFS transporter [Clostridiales Family XIII bacterium]|nr:multidrug efflux MFS transporter [Clostridiales Family XIII bacterium]
MPIWKRNLIVCWIGMFATGIGLSQVAPIMPLFIHQLGVYDADKVAELSGLAFGVTFIVSAIFSPIWGYTADRIGRKSMLLRASLGMAIVIFGIAFTQNIQMLVLFRALLGAITGYATACTTLIATQTDREHAGFALGVLSTSNISGSLIGPTFGGFLAEQFSIQMTFYVTSGLMLLTFFLTLFFVKENFVKDHSKAEPFRDIWRSLPEKTITVALFIAYFMIYLVNFSIQPILTLYISELSGEIVHLALISGLVFSVSGLASILSAPVLGRLSDRVGTHKIMWITAMATCLTVFPQAFVTTVWQLAVLRFLMGLASGGLQPSINVMLKKIVPEKVAGTIFGYSNAAGYLGVFVGSVLGGQIASLLGFKAVFLLTGVLTLITAFLIYFMIYRNINNRKRWSR